MSTVFFQWLYAFLLVLWCGYGWAGVFFFEDQLSLGFAEVGWSVAWVVGGGGEVALSRRWEMRCRRVETGIGSWHEFICASKVATMVFAAAACRALYLLFFQGSFLHCTWWCVISVAGLSLFWCI